MTLEEQVLNKEQVEKLKELGFEFKNNSMVLYHFITDIYGDSKDGDWHAFTSRDINMKSLLCEIEYIPTLTFPEIFEILPEEIENGTMGKDLRNNKIVYMSGYGSGGNDYTFEGENLLGAAFDALCWLLENKKI